MVLGLLAGHFVSAIGAASHAPLDAGAAHWVSRLVEASWLGVSMLGHVHFDHPPADLYTSHVHFDDLPAWLGAARFGAESGVRNVLEVRG